MRWPLRLSWVAVALAAVVFAAVIVVGALSGELALSWRGTNVELVVSALLGAMVLATAVIVARHVPDNWVGPVIGLMGLEPFVNTAFDAFGDATWVGSERAVTFATLAEVSWMWIYVPVGLLLALFPDGRPATRAGRFAVAGLPTVAVAFQVLASLSGASDVVGALAQPLATGLVPVFLGLLVTASVALGQRYRRGGPVTRAQLRWLALAGMGLPLTLLVGSLGYFVLDTAIPVLAGVVLVYLSVPVATAMAILRHRLFDVDDALVASVVYSAMTALVVGVFAAVSVAVGVFVGRSSVIAAAVVAAGVAFALGSARGRVEHRLGRVLFPARERSLLALARLHERVRAGTAAPKETVAVLREALADPELTMTYTGTDATGAGEASGGGPPATPVLLGSTLVGYLHPGAGARNRPSKDVAAAAALLLETARLQADLTSALAEVEASRERILLVGYGERRRLERDLHDGAQQRLVSLGLRLRLLQRGLGPEMVAVADELDQAVAQVSTAVSELRLLAHGIRPSSLDDGLAAALAHLARITPLPLALEVEAGDDLPDAVSTTAYYVVAEAVTNAVRHSEADRIRVRLTKEGDALTVLVSDDGRGGAGPRPGSGLAGLDDRVSGAGGRLRLVSPLGRGTVVEAMLPCGL